MTKILNFKDNNSQCWVTIRMENGDPIWVSVAQTGVIVKKTKIGLFGPKLFVSEDIYEAVRVASDLNDEFKTDLVPHDVLLTNPVLKSFVNAILHFDTVAQATVRLNGYK